MFANLMGNTGGTSGGNGDCSTPYCSPWCSRVMDDQGCATCKCSSGGKSIID